MQNEATETNFNLPEPVLPPVPAAGEPPKPKFRLIWLVPLAIVVLGTLGIWLWGSLVRTPLSTSRPAPVTTTAPTPTPERRPSAVATQSAFLSLQAHVASLSANLNNFILEDPILTPPVLDLPLGF